MAAPSMQIRFATILVATVLFSFLALWFTGDNPCANHTVTATGVIPLMLCATVATGVSVFVTEPRIVGDGAAAPTAQLQRWCWQLCDARNLKQQRQVASQCADEKMGAERQAAALAQEPVFAMELAVKAYVWSRLAYKHKHGSTAGRTASSSNAALCALLSSYQRFEAWAKELWGVRQLRAFEDKATATLVLVAWSSDTIIVAARGTQYRSNIWQDSKVSLSAGGTRSMLSRHADECACTF